MSKGAVVTAEEAVRCIKDGDRVVIGHACGEPVALTSAFSRRIPELTGVETVHMVGMGESLYCLPEAEGHVHHNSLFVGGKERKAIAEGRGDHTPRYFSAIPDLFRNGALPVDVALVEVSAPDRHGFVSFGISVDYTITAAKKAKTVIAQVNANMPRCHGECFMHVSEFDYLVYEDTPLIELHPGPVGGTEQAIARYCSELVPDGATLQLGIGSLPDAVAALLTDRRNLGIHSEMFSDAVVELVERGVVNNAEKTLLPGKMAVSFLMGTRRLYDFVDDNPMVYMAPVEYINNPYVIAQNKKLISINSCVQVDLMGQVCSESVGLTQISGVGGQVDFVRGASMSEGGVSIIATASTAKNGTVSKIVPFLDPGMAVTTNRYDVMNIVTEYGIASLAGKTLRQRARALIDIAHPDFRASLAEEFGRRFNEQY